MLELLSYNTQYGTNIDKINDWVQELPTKPDIVCYQEYPASHAASHSSPLGPSYDSVFAKGWTKKGNNYGELTAFKKGQVQLVGYNVVTLGLSFLERKARGLSDARSALLTTFDVQGEKLVIANVHLSWFSAHAFRRKQLEELLKVIPQESTHTLIVGDFNYSSLVAGNSLPTFMQSKGFQTAGEKLSTHKFLGQQLDYVFQRGCKVVDVRLEDLSLSDHKPIVVKFDLA